MWVLLGAVVYLAIFVYLPFALLPWYTYLLILSAYYVLWTPCEFHAFRLCPLWTLIRNRYFHWTTRDLSGVVRWHQDRAYAFVLYPHGIGSVSHIFEFACTGSGPTFLSSTNIRVFPVVARPLLWLPLLRELCGWAGGIDATRQDMEATMKAGQSISVCAGGVREIMFAGTNRIVRRRATLRLIYDCRGIAVPVVSTRELELYSVRESLPWLQRLCLRFVGYPFPMLYRGVWGSFLPKPIPQTVLIGKPLDSLAFADRFDLFEQTFYERLVTLAVEYQCPLEFFVP